MNDEPKADSGETCVWTWFDWDSHYHTGCDNDVCFDDEPPHMRDDRAERFCTFCGKPLEWKEEETHES